MTASRKICTRSASRSSNSSRQKKDNFKQAAYLMKQADTASTNEEANRLNEKAVALKVANSKLEAASSSSTTRPTA